MANHFKLTNGQLADIEQFKTMLEECGATIGQMVETLHEITQAMRDAFDERSERWQESDRAEDVTTWLDELDEAATKVEDLAEAVTDVTDGLDNLTAEPDYSS